MARLILNVARGLREEVRDVRNDFGDLRERMARLEGLFEGCTGQRSANDAAT